MQYNQGLKNMIDRQIEQGKKEDELKRNEILKLFLERARLHMMIRGKVTGVFFRDYAKKEADALGLTGWIKNTAKGNVEIVAEGEKMRLRELLLACEKGSPLAKVAKVDYTWEEFTGEFTEFVIQ